MSQCRVCCFFSLFGGFVCFSTVTVIQDYLACPDASIFLLGPLMRRVGFCITTLLLTPESAPIYLFVSSLKEKIRHLDLDHVEPTGHFGLS
jgi:hypothetical protein